MIWGLANMPLAGARNRGGGGRKRLVDGEQRRSAYEIGGEGVLVEDRRRGVVVVAEPPKLSRLKCAGHHQ